MSTLAEKVIEWLNRFPEPKAKFISEFFTQQNNPTNPNQAKAWLAGKGNPPSFVYEWMMNQDFAPEELAADEQAPGEESPGEPGADTVNGAEAPRVMVAEETVPEGLFTEMGKAIDELFVRTDELSGLFGRVEILEAQYMEISSGMAGRLPPAASRLRPGGGVPYTGFDPNNPPQIPAGRMGAAPAGFGARRVPPTPGNGYLAGVQTGRAPTRQQAHWSSMGQRGQLAQPAQHRQPTRLGNRTWNWSKDKLAAARTAKKTAASA